MSTSEEFIVSKPAGELAPGDRFIFAEDMGGEGETVTVESTSDSFGTVSIETEELDFTIEAQSDHWLTIAPEVEEMGGDVEYGFPFEELDDRFHKLPNPSDPSEGDHWEHADAVKMPTNQVWTIVEGDEGNDWWALTGFHIVNKLFYVVTKEPWSDDDSSKNFRY